MEVFGEYVKYTKFNHELLTHNLEHKNLQLFSVALLYPRSQFIRAIILLSSSITCERDCSNNFMQDTAQRKKCEESCDLFDFEYLLQELHNNRFFDTSEVMNSILNNISECKK